MKRFGISCDLSAPLHQRVKIALRDESGSTLVELGIVLPLFLLIYLGLIDFGRFGYSYVMAEKATQLAARTAAVRPAACAGVPLTNARGPVAKSTVPPKFGTSCKAGANICANPGTVSCVGNSTNPTANEVWDRVNALLPNHATIGNLQFSYNYDSNLGFLGGPYIPIVTVELRNLNFEFVTPLSALAGLAGATGAEGLGADIAYPSMSVSLPAEDLAQGEAG